MMYADNDAKTTLAQRPILPERLSPRHTKHVSGAATAWVYQGVICT